MKVVWKFELSPIDEAELPLNAQVLKVKAIGNDVFMWVLVDDEVKTKQKRTFMSFATGQGITDKNLSYIDTVFFENGFVFHVFEKN